MLLQKPIQCNAAQSRRINALPALHSSQLRCGLPGRLSRPDAGLQRRIVGAAATAAHKGAPHTTTLASSCHAGAMSNLKLHQCPPCAGTAPLTVQPVKEISGHVKLPGSKSLSNRILLMAALAEGTTRVKNLLVRG